LLGLGLGVSALLGLGSVLSLSLGTLGLSLVYWWAWNAEPVWLTEALLPPPPPEPPLVEPLDMVALPDGTFLMGAPETDRLAFSDEKPAHAVTVTAFCISRFLITRQFYRDIIGQEPEAWADDTDDGRLPANHLTWFEAIAFCNALSVRVGLHPCYEVMDQHVAWDTQADG
jgi:formylglycine-generating enzyme required for sulfatase activity